jgi:hypothetical protein
VGGVEVSAVENGVTSRTCKKTEKEKNLDLEKKLKKGNLKSFLLSFLF